MKIYYFGGHVSTDLSNIDQVEDSNFDGILFTYNPNQGDFFTIVARTLREDQKLKYMIAVRPHALSAQYLCMINQSINTIQPNRLEINIISGHIKPDEVEFGGILGPVNDQSSIPDRSNYMIEYIKELKNMEKRNIEIPNCYVTCTNEYALEAASKLGYKIIFPYREYKNGYFPDKSIEGQMKPGKKFDLKGKKIMLAVGPIIRDTQEEIDKEFPKDVVVHTQDGKFYIDRPRFINDTAYFTYDNFIRFMEQLKSDGINEVMFNGVPKSERNNLMKYVKKYKENE
jgi:hypothetical protein